MMSYVPIQTSLPNHAKFLTLFYIVRERYPEYEKEWLVGHLVCFWIYTVQQTDTVGIYDPRGLKMALLHGAGWRKDPDFLRDALVHVGFLDLRKDDRGHFYFYVHKWQEEYCAAWIKKLERESLRRETDRLYHRDRYKKKGGLAEPETDDYGPDDGQGKRRRGRPRKPDFFQKIDKFKLVNLENMSPEEREQAKAEGIFSAIIGRENELSAISRFSQNEFLGISRFSAKSEVVEPKQVSELSAILDNYRHPNVTKPSFKDSKDLTTPPTEYSSLRDKKNTPPGGVGFCETKPTSAPKKVQLSFEAAEIVKLVLDTYQAELKYTPSENNKARLAGAVVRLLKKESKDEILKRWKHWTNSREIPWVREKKFGFSFFVGKWDDLAAGPLVSFKRFDDNDPRRRVLNAKGNYNTLQNNPNWKPRKPLNG